MKKELVIVFEGMDKVGKTTIKDIFNKKTNFKYLVLDRLFVSSLVYNELFKRKDKQYYLKLANTFLDNFNVIVVYVSCSKEIQKNRLIENDEVLPKELKDYNKVNSLFLQTIDSLKLKHFQICTTNCLNGSDFEKKADFLIKKIREEEMQNEQ